MSGATSEKNGTKASTMDNEKNSAKASTTDNEFKLQYAKSTIAVFLLVALLAGHVTVNFQLAFGIFCSYQMWGLFWIKILYNSPNIYSLRIPTTVLSDWIPMSIPSADGMKIRKDRVVTSISELSGIRGGHMMIALRVMTATINMMVLVAIQQDLHYRGTYLFNIQSSADIVPICMLIQAIGFFLTGHFELNLMDAAHALGHYMGVMGIFIGSLSIGFLLRWNLFSLFLISLEFGLCFYWFAYCEKCEKKSEDISVVTRNSKMCIGIELALFYVTNVIAVLAVYASGANEGNIFASPFKK